MARVSEADARRLGLLAAGRKRAKATSLLTGSDVAKPKPRIGRQRAARTVYDADEIVFEVVLGFDPRPKERPRTVTDLRRIEGAFLAAKGNLAAFRSVLGKGASRTFTPKDTKVYEDLIAQGARRAMNGRAPLKCPVETDITFVLEGNPEFWPTSAADGDGDNLEKAVLDALNGIVYIDDRQTVRSSRVKVCGPIPKVMIRVRPAQP